MVHLFCKVACSACLYMQNGILTAPPALFQPVYRRPRIHRPMQDCQEGVKREGRSNILGLNVIIRDNRSFLCLMKA